MSSTDFDDRRDLSSRDALVAAALALGARNVAGWSPEEEALAATVAEIPERFTRELRAEVRSGADPLGECFCRLFSANERRPRGATYTPAAIVDAMIAWAKRSAAPERVVDPGVGSARFLIAAGRAFPNARLVGVEIDPLSALIARASIVAAGFSDRAEVLVRDFRASALPTCQGTTLFVGNPPYVRHHLIEPRWKRWLTETARAKHLSVSQLAGLHVHFFLATLLHARTGDRGVYVTAAEWLDVNYGQLVRELLLEGLGASSIHVIEPDAQPFAGAATTAAVTCFEVGTRPPSVRMRRVASSAELNGLAGGHHVSREDLASSRRWTFFTRSSARCPDGFVELGEICRVHRGAATGANKIWIADHSTDLPASVLFPSVTRARELFSAQSAIADAGHLRCVIDLPRDLDALDVADRHRVEHFLRRAKAMGAHTGYIARHRRAWWSVGLREPAPILATYMARRPPAFVRNMVGVRHINIAHGLYPRESISAAALDHLAKHLSASTSVADGRTYSGGLTKFEPREMERLMVPLPNPNGA